MSLETHERLEPLAEEWDRLADRVGAAPWLRPGWIGAWWRAFGAGALRVLAVRDGDELVGVLPLVLRRGALVSPTNWHTPEFGLLGRAPADRAELARGLFGQRRRSVALSFLERSSGLDECEEAAREAGYRILLRVQERSPFVQVTGSHEAYVGSLDRKHVKELRRLRRRLEEQGQVRFELLEDTAHLGECLEMESAGWKGESGTSIASRPETLAFYSEVTSWAARRGTLRIAFLRLDERPVAFELLIEDGGVLYDLKGGYDEELRRYAPGQLIAAELIAYVFAAGLASFEFLGSDDPYKLAWTGEVRERLRFQAFASNPFGAVDFGANAYGRPLVRRALIRASRR